MANSEDLSDESKKLLQNQLGELAFVDDKDKLKAYSCCCCEALAIYHCTVNCKHIFCNYCYLRCFNGPCPICKTVVKKRYQDWDFDRKVLELKLECKYKKYGCKEIYELRYYLNHIAKCKFSTERLLPKLYRPDPTIKQLNNDFLQMHTTMKVMEADNRKQKYAQEFTSEMLRNMKTEILQLQDALKKSDEKNMGQIPESFKRDIAALKKNCEQTTEALKAESKKQLETLREEHKAEIQKLETEQRKRMEELETKITALKFLHDDDCNDTLPSRFIWRIPGINQILKNLVENKPFENPSEEDFSTRNGLQFRPGIFTSEDNENINIAVNFDPDSSCSEFNLHLRRYILLDQKTMGEDNVELMDIPLFKKNSTKDAISQYHTLRLFFHPRLLRGENKYVKNDEILVKILFEPIAFLTKQMESQDGVLVWRIDNYSQKKSDVIPAINDCITSKPFKTSQVEYTARLYVHLNGCGVGEGKYISVSLGFLLGEHDDFLPVPFKCKYTFYLMDQSDSSTKTNISEEFIDKFEEVDWVSPKGSLQFALQSTVESSKYSKNDSILIRATAEIL